MQRCKPIIFILGYLFFLAIFPIFFYQARDVYGAVLRNLLAYATLSVLAFALYWKELIGQLKEIKSPLKFILSILMWTISALVLVNILGNFVAVEGVSENEESIRISLNASPVLMLLPVVLFGPFVEEIMFRFIMVGKFAKHHWIGVLLSSLLFGMIHVTAGDFVFLYIYVFMGVILGIYYAKTKNIWYSTGAHILNNLFVSLLTLWLTSS